MQPFVCVELNDVAATTTTAAATTTVERCSCRSLFLRDSFTLSNLIITLHAYYVYKSWCSATIY